MVGRTHGQPGSPITFGFKVASWADEVRRHLERLAEGRPRWLVGQLGGAVGVLGFFAPHGAALRAAFCAELGLADPGISWLTSRDRLAEFGALLAMICGTLARIGNEVYELQRPEIGELREPTTPDTVGSITMPHKRNPEGSEHLDTLARLVRANAAVLLEGMVVGHERDGRGWKAEWVALPEVCLLTGVALRLARRLLSGLVVDVETMRANLERPATAGSERVLAGLTRRLGKHAAQRLLHDVLAPASRDVHEVLDALVADGAATEQDREAWTSWEVGDGRHMVDEVVGPRPARPVRGAGRMDVSRPRADLATLPTPLVRAARLERALDAGPLYIKRDDLTGFGVAGNKARALEFLLGAALAAAPTCSSRRAARRRTSVRPRRWPPRVVGMDCDLVFPGEPPDAGAQHGAGAGRGSPTVLRRCRDARPARRRRHRARERSAAAAGGRTPCRGAGQPSGSTRLRRCGRELAHQFDAGRCRRPDGGGGNGFRGHPGGPGRGTGRVRPALAGGRRRGEPAGRPRAPTRS